MSGKNVRIHDYSTFGEAFREGGIKGGSPLIMTLLGSGGWQRSFYSGLGGRQIGGAWPDRCELNILMRSLM